MPTLAIVHDNIDGRSSIGAIAAWDAREAIRRGWTVLAVCHDLDLDLAGSVTHLPLRVPPAIHLVQYSAARTCVRAALRGKRPDVVFVHQPQLAALADIWNVHYLERAARQAGGPVGHGVRNRLRDALGAAVAAREDDYLRRLPTSVRLLFCGDGLAADFARLYGPPQNSRTLYNPARSFGSQQSDRRASRSRLIGHHTGPVVGFLGGADPRKGGDLVRRAVEQDPELFLVHAGPTRLDVGAAALRSVSLGHLHDVTALLDVVDALVVPSRFDPFPLVVPEAAARGVPVIVSPAVGSARLVVDTGAGMVWDGSSPLGPLVRRAATERAGFLAGGARLVYGLDPARLADERFAEIDAAFEARARRGFLR